MTLCYLHKRQASQFLSSFCIQPDNQYMVNHTKQDFFIVDSLLLQMQASHQRLPIEMSQSKFHEYNACIVQWDKIFYMQCFGKYQRIIFICKHSIVIFTSHLYECKNDLQQKCTQPLTPYTVSHDLSYGVIRFVTKVSSRNQFFILANFRLFHLLISLTKGAITLFVDINSRATSIDVLLQLMSLKFVSEIRPV